MLYCECLADDEEWDVNISCFGELRFISVMFAVVYSTEVIRETQALVLFHLHYDQEILVFTMLLLLLLLLIVSRYC